MPLEPMIKMAVMVTLADTIELLAYLRAESSNTHQQKIDEMIQRLLTMMKSI